MEKQPRVVLNYAIEDRKKVEEIYDRLVAEGFQPWMDSQDLKGGEIWEKQLVENLKKADFVLVFLSKNSINRRGSFQSEVKNALSVLSLYPPGKIFLIPVRLEESPVPESLSHIHAVQLYKENGWNELIRALKHRTGDQKAIEEVKSTIRKIDFSERHRRHIFVAMPFSVPLTDVYVYGIQRSVEINSFTCERADRNSFTGSILDHIKHRISTAAAVIADLTGGNPNVYLELGYAWGCNIPTILLIQDINQLQFDVKDQRCIQYESIRALEEKLTQELAILKSSGRI